MCIPKDYEIRQIGLSNRVIHMGNANRDGGYYILIIQMIKDSTPTPDDRVDDGRQPSDNESSPHMNYSSISAPICIPMATNKLEK